MSVKPEWSVGDVFTIPLEGRRAGVGQIVATYGKHQYFFAVFDPAYKSVDAIDVHVAVRAHLALLALSLDAKLFHQHWKVIGHAEVSHDIPLPAYKEGGTDGAFRVVDYSGQLSREATAEEARRLSYRTTVAPVRIEAAFRAKHGEAEWAERFDALTPDYELTTENLFGQS